MKTFGTATLKPFGRDHYWEVTGQPHVIIRLKGVLGGADKSQVGKVWVRATPAICRDLHWFSDRYPLVFSEPDRVVLESGSKHYVKVQEQLERVQAPNYVAREFQLALPPRHYQSVAAEAYLIRGTQLLADHVGLGKSITALAALTDKKLLPALIVVQAHLPKQWKSYAHRFLPFAEVHIIKTGKLYQLPPADIYICTYHKLAQWAEILTGLVKSLCLDECQELRHNGSKKYNAAVGIRSQCTHAQGLSATPIFNYGGEIHNVLEVISPNEVGNKVEFEREWCTRNGTHAMLKNPEAFGSYLRENGLMLRRTRSEVGLELPPVQTVVEEIEYNDKVLMDLDKVATELAHRILSKELDFHSKGEAARQFDMKLRQATGISKAPYVAAFVKMLLDEGEQVVLTAWHRACYDIYASMLTDHKIVYYTGTESSSAKQAAVSDFVSRKANLFVMSLRSGSGLDGLQEVSNIIVHGELDWSPSVHEQCRGRLFRDGQTKSVFEYYLVSDGGSDPVIADILGIKKAQSEGMLNPQTSNLVAVPVADNEARVKKLAQDYLARKRKEC